MRQFVVSTNLVVGLLMVVMYVGRYTVRGPDSSLKYDSPVLLLMGLSLVGCAFMAGRKNFKEDQ